MKAMTASTSDSLSARIGRVARAATDATRLADEQYPAFSRLRRDGGGVAAGEVVERRVEEHQRALEG